MNKAYLTDDQYVLYKNEKISYDKTWETIQVILKDYYGTDSTFTILNSNEVLVVINSCNKRMSPPTFSSLPKDGDCLPFGFRNRDQGRWLFSLDSVTKWLIRSS